MKANFWKFLFLSFIAAIALSAFSIYAAKQAIHQDPELFAKIEKQFGVRVDNFNIQFTEWGEDAMPYSSSWDYSIPTDVIEIRMLAGDVEIVSTEGDRVLVSAEGQVPSGAQQLVDVKVDKNKKLIIEEKFKKARNLHLTISIPKSFTKKVIAASMSGDIKMTGLELDSVDVGSASGDLSGESLLVTKFHAASISGDVTMEMRGPGNYDLRSTSGDVHLKMPPSDDVKFEAGSISGTIHNTHRSNPQGKFTVEVGTTSGDVKVE